MATRIVLSFLTRATLSGIAATTLVAAGVMLGSAPRAHADPQTVTLGVANSRWHNSVKEFDSDDCKAPSNIHNAASGSVGWGQGEDKLCYAIVAQRAVLFDTAPLDTIPEKVINRAVLTYDESRGCWGGPYSPMPAGPVDVIDCWQSGGGDPQVKPDGCVVVRTTAQEWRGKGIKGPLPYVATSRPTITRISPREWDVTEAFTWQLDPRTMPLVPPGGPSIVPGRGFLLTGGITALDQLSGDDDTMCMSAVDNVQLRVTYTVPPAGGGFRMPN